MIEALISAHRRLIILSIFRHEVVALIELFMLLCTGGVEYGWRAFKAQIYTRYTCFKAFGSAVSNPFLLYRWEGHAPFLSLFPPSCLLLCLGVIVRDGGR